MALGHTLRLGEDEPVLLEDEDGPDAGKIHEETYRHLGFELILLHSGGDDTERPLREVEAECVAMICCESLALPGVEYSRGYIQHWLLGETIPEKSAQRIFQAADRVLKAGQAS
jgi:hypothetical protein